MDNNDLITCPSDTVSTDMLYARPGIRPLKAAWAGPGGSPSLGTYVSLISASGGSIDTWKRWKTDVHMLQIPTVIVPLGTAPA